MLLDYSGVLFTIELLEGLASSFRNAESGEDTEEHEESEDLHDVGQPWASSTASGTFDGTADTKRSNRRLGNDGTNFAGGSGDTVGGRTVASRKALSRDDECRSIGAKVEEELGENIESQETVVGDLVVSESEYTEEDRLGIMLVV